MKVSVYYYQVSLIQIYFLHESNCKWIENSKEYKDYEGDVLNLGLKIYTNFDSKIQDTLTESVNANYAGIKQASNVAMVVLNNENSGISALYGGKKQTFPWIQYCYSS